MDSKFRKNVSEKNYLLVLILYLNPYEQYFGIVCKPPVTSRQHNRRPMFFLFKKKKTSKFWLISDLLSSHQKSIFDTIFEHLMTKSCLIQISQASCLAILVYISLSSIHEIYTSFDANPSIEVRGVFLDISKAFDQVWQEEFMGKTKCMGVKGHLHTLF